VGASNNERKTFLIGIVMADRNTIPVTADAVSPRL
jgi:hypothetical protein